MVLDEEDRLEALSRGAHSEKSALPLLPPLLPLPLLLLLLLLLLLPAVGFPAPLAGCCSAAVASGAAKKILGAQPGRAPLLSDALWLGMGSPGYRATVRRASGVGRRYLRVPVLLPFCSLKAPRFGF